VVAGVCDTGDYVVVVVLLVLAAVRARARQRAGVLSERGSGAHRGGLKHALALPVGPSVAAAYGRSATASRSRLPSEPDELTNIAISSVFIS
jgi:hypothetical protein